MPFGGSHTAKNIDVIEEPRETTSWWPPRNPEISVPWPPGTKLCKWQQWAWKQVFPQSLQRTRTKPWQPLDLTWAGHPPQGAGLLTSRLWANTAIMPCELSSHRKRIQHPQASKPFGEIYSAPIRGCVWDGSYGIIATLLSHQNQTKPTNKKPKP